MASPFPIAPYPAALDLHGEPLGIGDYVIMVGQLPENYPRVWNVEPIDGSSSLIIAGARKRRVELRLIHGDRNPLVSKFTPAETFKYSHFDYIVVKFEALGWDTWLDELPFNRAIRLNGRTRDAAHNFTVDLSWADQQKLVEEHGGRVAASIIWLEACLRAAKQAEINTDGTWINTPFPIK